MQSLGRANFLYTCARRDAMLTGSLYSGSENTYRDWLHPIAAPRGGRYATIDCANQNGFASLDGPNPARNGSLERRQA